MLKKVFGYQRLLLNSILFNSSKIKNQHKLMIYYFIFIIMAFMNYVLFFGKAASLNTFFYIALPVTTVCLINNIINNGERVFESVPVSRKFIVFNMFLFSIVLTAILYLLLNIFGIAFVWLLVGIMYMFFPSHIDKTPPEITNQIINTTKSNILMLIVVILILFLGTSIAFIKRWKTRAGYFTLFSALGYGLLFILKINMPISPTTQKIEFFESFSIMPSANTILLILALVAALVWYISIAFAYKIYCRKNFISNY